MKHGKIVFGLAAALAVVGCSTIKSAREAQEAVVAKASGENVPTGGPYRLGGMSLAEMVGFAMTNRPSMVVKRHAVEAARLRLKALAADAPLVSATPWTAPKLSVGGGWSESSPGSTMREADFATRGDPSAALSLSLPIWDFGRNDAQLAAQSERVLSAEFDLLDAGYTVFAEVSLAYFNFLENAALWEVARTNEYEYAAHLERAQSMFEAGEAKQLDVLKAKLDLSNARERTVAVSNAVWTSAIETMRTMGLVPSQVPSDEFARLGADALAYVTKAFPPSDVSAPAATELARTNAPLIRLARARLRAASSDVDYAVADLLPEISATASFSWTDPLWFFRWGVNVSQSLFQGFRKTTAVDSAVVAMRSAEAEVDAAEQQSGSAVAIAITTRDNARVALATAQVACAQAKENLEVVRREFEVGEASRVDYAAAVSSYVTELGNWLAAFYSEQRSEAALFKLMGIYPEFREEKVKGADL